MQSDTVIDVQNLSKKYRIGAAKKDNLRETIGGLFGARSDSQEATEFWALKDVNFTLNHGDAVGIIGKNGAGKSTLLKILSRITEPTTGRIQINGRVSSLLEVGTGFHPELTGKENIYLNGTILGMSRKEVKSKFDEIVEFSGVEKFISTPVKHYSSGMYVRLAFAVAAHLEPDILIIDEVLAVGDAEFQKKCLGKMEDVANQGRTVIFVSHNMDAVSNLCNSAIYINDGRIETISKNVDGLISKYLNNLQANGYSHGLEFRNIGFKNEIHSIDRMAIMNDDFELHQENIHFDQNINILIEGKIFQNNPALNLGVNLYNHRNDTLCWSWVKNDRNQELKKMTDLKKISLICKIPKSTLNEGSYKVEILSVLHNIKNLIKKTEGPAITFNVVGGDKGVQLNLPLKWSYK